MRVLLSFLLILTFIACKTEPTVTDDVVQLSGKLKTVETDKITVQGRGYNKVIAVDAKGRFADTLKVTEGIFAINNGRDRLTMFLKNGYDLDLTFKGPLISDGAIFEGVGAPTNNFIEAKRMFYLSAYANPETYFSLEESEFKKRLAEAKSKIEELRNMDESIDSIIIGMDKRNDDRFFGYIESNYDVLSESYRRLAKGQPSPQFTDYENIAGGATSLNDFIGSVVFIDVWATWCTPCRAQIPYLKKLEEELAGQNIKFIGISVDVEEAYETWKEVVKETELPGIQLFADKNFNSDFIIQYGINAIPRYIILDTEGNIVDAEAPRPSEPRLKEILEEVLANS